MSKFKWFDRKILIYLTFEQKDLATARNGIVIDTE